MFNVVCQATMLKKSKNKIKRCNTEPSLYFPNSGGASAASASVAAEPQSSTSSRMQCQPDGDSGPL